MEYRIRMNQAGACLISIEETYAGDEKLHWYYTFTPGENAESVMYEVSDDNWILEWEDDVFVLSEEKAVDYFLNFLKGIRPDNRDNLRQTLSNLGGVLVTRNTSNEIGHYHGNYYWNYGNHYWTFNDKPVIVRTYDNWASKINLLKVSNFNTEAEAIQDVLNFLSSEQERKQSLIEHTKNKLEKLRNQTLDVEADLKKLI